MAITKPDVIVEPFCATGAPGTDYIVPIKTSIDPDIMTQDKGIPISMATPLPSGGTPVTREATNGYMYLYSSILAWIQAGGTFTFEPTVSSLNTGYPIGTVLWAESVKNFVISLIANNTFDFVITPSYIDGTKWETITSLSYPDISDVGGLVTISGNNGLIVRSSADFVDNGLGAFVRITRDSSTLSSGFLLRIMAEAPSSVIPGATNVAAIQVSGGPNDAFLAADYSGTTHRWYSNAPAGNVNYITHAQALATLGDLSLGNISTPFTIGAANFRVNGSQIFPNSTSGLSISGIYTTGSLAVGTNTYTINLVGTVITAARPYTNRGPATVDAGPTTIDFVTCEFNATEIILIIEASVIAPPVVISFSIEI